ncbi:hypothetical protein Q5P01_012349 [Channa striata]|uniref:Nudix (nucleoside diphosphate linked moiety X)-type motif 7 n=1 Tax=Channa striata TaxID=64152 RepID=A0AA88MRK7_CHASR|nr:hypothetical protein Q5P01_012349 [Channa striata]
MHTREEETAAILKQFDIGNKFSYLPMLPKASVLIPLFVKNGELHTLMTLRSKELRTSAGEVCFPGGRGTPATKMILFPIINKSGLLVTPVVGFIEEHFCPCPNPAEVSAVFTVPLDFFTSEKDHYAAHGAAGMMGPLHSFYFVDPDSGTQYHIWGLTAMLAIMVAVLALRKKPEFSVGFDSEDPSSFFQQVLQKRISKL